MHPANASRMKIPDKTGDKQASEVRFSTWPEGVSVVVSADGGALIGGSTIVDAPGPYGGRSPFDLVMLPYLPGGGHGGNYIIGKLLSKNWHFAATPCSSQKARIP